MPLTPDAATICRRLVIHGLVQGVGFRWSLVREAERIGGLAGWVRNCRDGTVEAVIAGDRCRVAELIAWAEIGPPAARVSRVLINDTTSLGLPTSGVEQRPTL